MIGSSVDHSREENPNACDLYASFHIPHKYGKRTPRRALRASSKVKTLILTSSQVNLMAMPIFHKPFRVYRYSREAAGRGKFF